MLPELHGRGIYNHLWMALIEKARENKFLEIGSATRLDNYRMRAVAKAQGRIEEAVTLSFKVPVSV